MLTLTTPNLTTATARPVTVALMAETIPTTLSETTAETTEETDATCRTPDPEQVLTTLEFAMDLTMIIVKILQHNMAANPTGEN